MEFNYEYRNLITILQFNYIVSVFKVIKIILPRVEDPMYVILSKWFSQKCYLKTILLQND